jgi:hypothetical protein
MKRGELYAQELSCKIEAMPDVIRWAEHRVVG